MNRKLQVGDIIYLFKYSGLIHDRTVITSINDNIACTNIGNLFDIHITKHGYVLPYNPLFKDLVYRIGDNELDYIWENKLLVDKINNIRWESVSPIFIRKILNIVGE